MRNKVWWLAPLMALAAGCASPAVVAPAAPSMDGAVVDVLHGYFIDGTRAELVDYAHKICEAAAVKPRMSVIHILMADMPMEKAARFYGVATTAYCPEAAT